MSGDEETKTTQPAAAALEEDDAGIEEELKKAKKKSSKKKKEEEESGAGGDEVPKKKKKSSSSAAVAEEGGEEAPTKKKKKSKEEDSAALAQQVSTENVDEELDAMFKDLKVTKKKKKSSSSASASATGGHYGYDAGPAAPKKDINFPLLRDEYIMLLGRVYDNLRANNPELLKKDKALLRPPAVQRVGTSRIIWTNFAEICKTMKRDQSHVMNYFLTELGTTGSMTAQEQFLLKGKFVPKYIESLLKKYIHEYVTCNMCRGVETKLQRDTNARMTVMTCDSCGASRAVATIQKGYVAATRATRKAARNAAG